MKNILSKKVVAIKFATTLFLFIKCVRTLVTLAVRQVLVGYE